MAYANGQFPTSATVALATAPGQRLIAAAAANWDALARDIQNRHGWLPYLTDSYRPYSVQERIFRERYRVLWSGSGPYGDVRYWQGVRWVRVTGAAAAAPGTSNHGWGKAVDCSGLGGFSGTRFRQLAALAPSYGFTNTEGRRVGEAWHWVFTGSGLVSNPIGGGGTVSNPNLPGAPAPITPEDFLSALSDQEQRNLYDRIMALPGANNGRGAFARVLDVGDGNALLAAIRDSAPDPDIERKVSEIHSRINFSVAPDGSPYKVAVQGDINVVLNAIAGVQAGSSAQVDVPALAAALKTTLGSAVADELSNRLKG